MTDSTHPHGAATPPSATTTKAAAPAACPFSAQAAAFDPFGAGYQHHPADYLRWARAQEPVFFSPQLGYWVVTRYDDVKAVFRDTERFSPCIALEKITPTGDEANAVLASYGYAMNRTLVNEDEPAHMPRRRVLMEPFTPEALKHHEPLVRQTVRSYLDRFINDGRADLVDQMLWEVPLTVALHFLGVPEEDMDQLRRYSIAHTVNTWGRPQAHEQVAVAHAVGNFWQLAGRILDKMRQDPSGSGWMKYGIRQQVLYPEVVTDSYLHSMMMAGIVAAHETTANATANAIKLLLQNPGAWSALCRDPSLIPAAVEECLRLEGSVAAWRRQAVVDVDVGGVRLAAGSRVLMVMASANHDERRFADPDALDLHRDNASDHLSFGYGAHQCMGKNLARLELQVFLEEFTKRLPHMRLCEQAFSWVPNTSFRGPEHLWVEWDPTRNPERESPELLATEWPVRLGDAAQVAPVRTLRVASVQAQGPDTVCLRLEPTQGQTLPRWTPGAHIELTCGRADRQRPYSLCGDPDDTLGWDVAVLRDPHSRGGSAWVHAELRSGDLVQVRGPRNHFRYDDSASKVLLVAGGIGITPLAPMALRARALGVDYALHYCGRSRAHMALLPALHALHGARLHVHASDEGQRLDVAALLAHPDEHTLVYACGPERLLAALQQHSTDWPADALRSERFRGGAPQLDPRHETAFEVELAHSGRTVHVPPEQTLLQALKGAGVAVASDCGEGLCGSCEVGVLHGEVDHRDRVLTRAERAQHNKLMACCSRVCGQQRLVLAL